MDQRRPNSRIATASAVATGQSTALDPSALKVLRNTYALLAMTVAFSAVTAMASMALNVPYLGFWMIIPYFGLLWGIDKTKHSSLGIVLTFVLTGFMGLTLGPILNAYLQFRGTGTIVMALGGTAAIFFAMSAYTLVTKKDLSGMGRFLMIGMIIAFVAAIANIFMEISALAMTVSAMMLGICSLMIAFQTSAIIHGGERNYISATVTLYVMLYNVFLSLLSFAGMGSDD